MATVTARTRSKAGRAAARGGKAARKARTGNGGNGRRPAPSRRADPVVTEIVRNAVVAITEEMKTNLMRTAYSMIIYEAQDFTVGLFSARAEIISIGIGLPIFVRGMAIPSRRC